MEYNYKKDKEIEEMSSNKKRGNIMIVRKAKVDFDIVENRSEPIMVVRKNGEEINVKIGDTFKFGPGLYRILGYKAVHKWPEINGVYPYNSAVKCELIRGYVLYDFKRFSSRGPNGEIYVQFSAETIAHFIISTHEKMEIVEKKRQELIERLEKEKAKKQAINPELNKNETHQSNHLQSKTQDDSNTTNNH